MPVPLPEPLRSRRRRLRLTYSVVVGVAVLAVALTMALVIGTGEAAHATLITSTAAAPVPTGTVRSSPSVGWSTGDRPAEGDPLWVGTVVTYSEHQLSGRDALTGAVRWSYRRDDLSVCDAAQQDGRAFVLFRRDGNCDELSTFDSGTGARGWFRTLADDGDGRLAFGGSGLVVTYPHSFHVVDLPRGVEFYSTATQPAGCTVTSIAPGGDGVLLTEHCGDGDHLVMYDYTGSQGAPRVSFRTSVPASLRAVDASTYAVTYDTRSGALTRHDLGTGTAVGTPSLSPTPTGDPGPTTTTAATSLLELGPRLYGVSRTSDAAWTLPDVVGPAAPVDRNGVQVMVATTTGAQLVTTATGAVVTSYRFGPPTDGTRVYPAGNGLVVASPVGDRGLAYLR